MTTTALGVAPIFPRVVTATKGGKTYRYLSLVESYREGGKTKQRVVGNLGNIDQYSDEEIRRLILKLRSFLHDPDFGTLDDLQTSPTKQFGVP